MTLITGKDFCFDVPDRDLVRIAMVQLRDAGERITLQSVSQVSGLNIQQVKAVLQAEQQRQASDGGKE